MDEVNCPWVAFGQVLVGQNYVSVKFEGCNFLRHKTKCLLKPWKIGDFVSCVADRSVTVRILDRKAQCCRVTAFFQRLENCWTGSSLRRLFKPKSDHDVRFLKDRFCRMKNTEYFADLLRIYGIDYNDFRYRIGMWLATKCREEPSCPYKPLLPENL